MMSAERFLQRLRAAGFELEVDDCGLVIKPATDVTDWIADLARDREVAIIDWLERDFSLPPQRYCQDCDRRLHLGGVRCPACRDAHPEPTCDSCGADFPGSNRSICDLCELEAASLVKDEVEEP